MLQWQLVLLRQTPALEFGQRLVVEGGWEGQMVELCVGEPLNLSRLR